MNTVNHHLKEIYDEEELQREATIRQYRIGGYMGTVMQRHVIVDRA